MNLFCLQVKLSGLPVLGLESITFKPVKLKIAPGDGWLDAGRRVALLVVDHHAVDHVLVHLHLFAELEQRPELSLVRVSFCRKL